MLLCYENEVEMRFLGALMIFFLICAGCDSQKAIPPGAPGGPPAGPTAKKNNFPPNAVSFGQIHAQPPKEWGEPRTLAGTRAFTIETENGKVFLSVFDPGVDSEKQIARFRKMIEPASAIVQDELTVGNVKITRVSGKGTRRTFSDDEFEQVARELPGEAIIGLVSQDSDAAIAVDGKTEAVEKFAPDLEAWIKTFK